jgi:hypothetical protein
MEWDVRGHRGDLSRRAMIAAARLIVVPDRADSRSIVPSGDRTPWPRIKPTMARQAWRKRAGKKKKVAGDRGSPAFVSLPWLPFCLS